MPYISKGMLCLIKGTMSMDNIENKSNVCLFISMSNDIVAMASNIMLIITIHKLKLLLST